MTNKCSRAAAVLLAVLLLVSSLAGCNGTKPNGGGGDSLALQQAKEALLLEVQELLQTYETIYTGMFRMIEYTQDYARNNAWDSLLKARASASAAMVEIRQMELPTLDLTEAEQTLLLDAGVEISAVQREFEALEVHRVSMDESLLLFLSTLEYDVFLKTIVEDVIPAMTALYREYFQLECRYFCNFANYLLLQTESADAWQVWEEKLPTLASYKDVWYAETDALEAATGAILDRIAVLEVQMGGIQGALEYTLELVQEAHENGNQEVLRREINAISGVPGYFPQPVWLPDVLHLYLTTDAEAPEGRLVRFAEVLDQAPTACHISCGEIPLEEVQRYEEDLKQQDLQTYGKWNESQDTWKMIAVSGDSSMMVQWTQEDTVLYLTEPVGCMIPELYLSAMANK